jgi:hypothetical protein
MAAEFDGSHLLGVAVDKATSDLKKLANLLDGKETFGQRGLPQGCSASKRASRSRISALCSTTRSTFLSRRSNLCSVRDCIYPSTSRSGTPGLPPIDRLSDRLEAT